MDHRMTRTPRLGHPHAASPARIRPARFERAVSWSDFRTAVRYDPTSRLLLAVPAISAKRAEHAWLGEAVTLHTRVGDAEEYRREYEHGAVYWSEATGAHEVHGAIADRWHEVGAEASFLGLPTTDELRLAGASGTSDSSRSEGGYAHFGGGSIYWTARHGAAIVHGMVRDIWALLGWERSSLGLPVADVAFDRSTGTFSGCFEHGSIAWSPGGGPDIRITTPSAADDGIEPDDREALGRLHGLQAGFAPST